MTAWMMVVTRSGAELHAPVHTLVLLVSTRHGAKDHLVAAATMGAYRRHGISLAARRLGSGFARIFRADSGSRRSPNVGFFGLLCHGNFGNDASLDVMVAYVLKRFPDASLDFFCPAPEQAVRSYGGRATSMHWNRHEYETADSVRLIGLKLIGKLVDVFRISAWARRQDVVIMPGMGAFDAALPLRPWGTPYTLFLLSVLGRLVGTKVALVSVGADETTVAATRWLYLAAARWAYYLSFRDVYSQDTMRRMGLRERTAEVYPDLVSAMAVPASSRFIPRTVGVGVIDYHGGNDDRSCAGALREAYVTKMKCFVRWLVDNGYHVRLLTGDRGDEVVVREIVEDLSQNRPGLGPCRVRTGTVDSLEDLMYWMADLDVVVATRFHNVLCALMLGKPTVSIGYAHKNDALMASMGLERFCQRADTFDLQILVQQFDELRECRHEISGVIEIHNVANRARIDDQFAVLDAQLFDGLDRPRSSGASRERRFAAPAPLTSRQSESA